MKSITVTARTGRMFAAPLNRKRALEPPLRRAALLVPVALAIACLTGCPAGHALEDGGEIASTEQALWADDGEGYSEAAPDETAGRKSRGPGYRCSNGTCTCSKEIFNDCEEMSAECSAGSLDALILCIQGWGTSHCTCTQGLTSSPDSPHQKPGGGYQLP